MFEDPRRAVLLASLPLGVVACVVMAVHQHQPDAQVFQLRSVGLPLLAVLLTVLVIALWRKPAIAASVGIITLLVSGAYMLLDLLTLRVRGEIPPAELLAQLPWLGPLLALAFIMFKRQRSSVAFGLGFTGCVAAIVLPAASREVFVEAFTASVLSPIVLVILLVFVSRVQVLLGRTEAALEVALEDSERDPLTDAGNRRAAERLFAQTGSVLLFDVDDFKKLNDDAGHDVGDRALRAVADAARASLRPGDALIRWGGEEFVALVDARRDEAYAIAERIRVAVHGVALTKPGVGLTISVGVAEVQAGDELDDAVDRADQAMYDAKREGKDRVVVNPSRVRGPER